MLRRRHSLLRPNRNQRERAFLLEKIGISKKNEYDAIYKQIVTFLAHNGEFDGVDELEDDELDEPVGEITFCSASFSTASLSLLKACTVADVILMLIDLVFVVEPAFVVVVVEEEEEVAAVNVDDEDEQEEDEDDVEVGDRLLLLNGENIVSSESSMLISVFKRDFERKF